MAEPIEIVVDTPKGSRSKYKFDEERGVFVLHKLLPAGATFPFDFGFVPGTRGDDGDAIDVVVLVEEPTFCGCRIPVRILGALEAEQTEKGGKTIRNDRLVATPETEKIHPEAKTLEDLPRGLLEQIEHFFVSYNEAEGRKFVIRARRGPAAARALIARSRPLPVTRRPKKKR